MHIRLLLLTFFLQFFPDLVKNGHVYILETPLFRVRNKQETIYCYSEEEKQEAIKKLGTKPEITRFKGLGEISPDEFARFIGSDMRKEPVIVMPEKASPVKIEATKRYGAEVVLFGKDSNDVTNKANEIAYQEGLTFLSPFDDEEVIAGHGVVGLDIIKEKPDSEVIICPVGSGAFISGILLALKETNPRIKIIGVEPLNSNAMWLSLQANKIVEKERIDTIADGLALKKPGELPFQIVKKYVDDIVLVNEDEIKRAVLLLLERAKLLVEPSGAVSIAALMFGKIDIKNKEIVAILSGGNVELHKLADFIKN
ncbi:MAG TPA: pyridoxal-phosphate dependent enzyme, partial [Atribacterota bacterium]|nr:pyridoxal-phosphate dependent enzyme [Atribacterota bacterium]